MPELMANTNHGKYPILIRTGAISQLGEVAEKSVRGRNAFVVTDEIVAPLYLAKAVSSLKDKGFKVSTFTVPAGESSKCREMLFMIYDELFAAGITRSDLIIALGGGVVGDLTGYAAASYLRGCPLIQVPTTLLAQVDSAIGGKTGIDMPYGKNLVGAFYQPKAVIIDPSLLKSLPRTRMAEGMAEVIKYGCIRDAMLFESIEKGMFDLEWILERCVRIKTTVVQNDEYDNGERMLLNFGHTMGHAIEKVSGYSTMTHGEAVAIGMVTAARIGVKKNMTSEKDVERIISVLEKWHLPTSTDLPLEELYNSMLSDKKKLSGKVYYVLLKSIGEAVTCPLSEAELRDVLEL
ncbi:MAG TPA: 3-dehydroquinate synthase [Bacillota bacterium]|nr:3-dehydroquinate synthase [Bacillota bacterium]HPE37942.1 3-dehydroquinate synthase [Bacillota bacterium]